MAGDNSEAAQLKGLSKYFNSVTINGRANVKHFFINKLSTNKTPSIK
jgi:hypothetical protein